MNGSAFKRESEFEEFMTAAGYAASITRESWTRPPAK
jgi:hypothetical protein